MQQAKFRGGYVSKLAAHCERHGVTMQFKIRSGNAGGQRLLKAPQNRPDSRCKLANSKRFGDVIVGPKVKAADAVFLAGAGRKKNNWNAGKVTAIANLAANFKAAVAGNHDIQQKENRWILARLGQHFITGNTKTHIEPGHLQVVADQIANVRIVFENKDILFQWLFVSMNQGIRITILTATAAGQPKSGHLYAAMRAATIKL